MGAGARQSSVTENDRDLVLVNRPVGGDSTACDELVRRHQSYVFTIALRVLNDEADAQEVTQDVFMKAFKSLHRFEGTAKFTTWLYRIATNEAISRRRRKRPSTTPVEEYHTGTSGHESLQALASEERQVYLQQALALLQGEDAALITMYYLEELTLAEIGAIVGQEAGNLKVRLHRARKRLAKQLHVLLATEVTSLL